MVLEGDYIYTINNKDWSSSSISQVSLLTYGSITTNLASTSTEYSKSLTTASRKPTKLGAIFFIKGIVLCIF